MHARAYYFHDPAPGLHTSPPYFPSILPLPPWAPPPPSPPQDYLYVEAEKESHVRDAIRGLRTLFSSKGVKLVPLNEMVDAITVRRQAKKDIGACGGVAWGRRKGGGLDTGASAFVCVCVCVW